MFRILENMLIMSNCKLELILMFLDILIGFLGLNGGVLSSYALISGSQGFGMVLDPFHFSYRTSSDFRSQGFGMVLDPFHFSYKNSVLGQPATQSKVLENLTKALYTIFTYNLRSPGLEDVGRILYGGCRSGVGRVDWVNCGHLFGMAFLDLV